MDAVGFGFPGQLAHQLQRKGNGAAQTVAGGDVAVHDHLGVQYLGPGQLVLESGMRRGLFALQQAELRQHAGRSADGGHLLACLCKGNTGIGHGLIGGKVRGAGDAAGQHHHVHVRIIDVLRQRVGGDVHLVAAGDGAVAGCAGHGHIHPGPAQQIHYQKCLALLGALGKKDDSFAHDKNLLVNKKPRTANAGRKPHRRHAGAEYQSADFFSSSSRLRRTLSSAPSTRLTRLMMALDAPVLSMISV